MSDDGYNGCHVCRGTGKARVRGGTTTCSCVERDLMLAREAIERLTRERDSAREAVRESQAEIERLKVRLEARQKAWSEELRLADAVVRELVEALRPFADIADEHCGYEDDDGAFVAVKRLRKARALVEKYGR